MEHPLPGPRSQNGTPNPGSRLVPFQPLSIRKGKPSSDLNIMGQFCVTIDGRLRPASCPGQFICTIPPSHGLQLWTAPAWGHPTMCSPTQLLVGVRVARSTGPLGTSSLQFMPSAKSVCTHAAACGDGAAWTGLLLQVPPCVGKERHQQGWPRAPGPEPPHPVPTCPAQRTLRPSPCGPLHSAWASQSHARAG